MKAAQYVSYSLIYCIILSKESREASTKHVADENIAYLYPILKQNLYRFQVCLFVFAGRVSLCRYEDFFVSLESEIPELEGTTKAEILSEVGLTLEGSYKRLMTTVEGSE